MSVFLLPYYIAFFAAAFAWPTSRLWQRHKINALVLPLDDSALGFIGVWFKVLMGAVFLVALGNNIDGAEVFLGPLLWAQHGFSKWIGTAALAISFFWITTAQAHMGKSWRIGIDAQSTTDLVTTGLFGRSRNPIFLGLRVNLAGLFLVAPNAATLTIWTAGEILMGVQVRLEEANLSATLGSTYDAYCHRVKRWI